MIKALRGSWKRSRLEEPQKLKYHCFHIADLPEPAMETLFSMLQAQDLGNLVLCSKQLIENAAWAELAEKVAMDQARSLAVTFASSSSSRCGAMTESEGTLESALLKKVAHVKAGQFRTSMALARSRQVQGYLRTIIKPVGEVKGKLKAMESSRLAWCQMLRGAEIFHACAQGKNWNPHVAIKTGEKYQDSHVETFLELSRAARLGHPAAQFHLAIAYMHGEGCQNSFEWSVFWLACSAPYYPLAKFCLATAVTFPSDQTSTPVGKPVPTHCLFVYNLYQAAADEGIPSAQVNMGMIHYGEFPFPEFSIGRDMFAQVDERAAVRWWTLAAEQEQVEALLNLGHAYDRGEGVKLSTSKAFELWSRAAKVGDARADYLLGMAYLEGKGTVRNVERAKAYFLRAMDQVEFEVVSQLSRERIAQMEQQEIFF